MILPEHTAHLTAILAAPSAADPSIGVAGSAPVVRWTGDVQIRVNEDVVDRVIGDQRVRITQAIIDIPVNIPVWPNQEDELTWTNLRDGSVETVKVRELQKKFIHLGYIRATARLS